MHDITLGGLVELLKNCFKLGLCVRFIFSFNSCQEILNCLFEICFNVLIVKMMSAVFT